MRYLLIILLMSACAPTRVVDLDISSLGKGYYDPKYIPSGCVYIIDGKEIKSC